MEDFILTLLFWFELCLEARAEILENVSLFFWEIWGHQKDILKLTDLYVNVKSESVIFSNMLTTIGRPPKIFLPSAMPVKGVAHFSITLLTIFVSHYLNTLGCPQGLWRKKNPRNLSPFLIHDEMDTQTWIQEPKSIYISPVDISADLVFFLIYDVFTRPCLPLLLI